MTKQVFPYEIDYYKKEDGTAPFREWLEALRNVNGRARIRIKLDRARQGNLGDHKYLGNGIWEMRLDCGPGYRVYFAKEENRIILLLIGGDKGTQSRDIAQAESHLQDHKGRC